MAPTEYSEFILRVSVPAALVPEVESYLTKVAKGFKTGRLSRTDREDFGSYAKHIRRKRIVS